MKTVIIALLCFFIGVGVGLSLETDFTKADSSFMETVNELDALVLDELPVDDEYTDTDYVYVPGIGIYKREYETVTTYSLTDELLILTDGQHHFLKNKPYYRIQFTDKGVDYDMMSRFPSFSHFGDLDSDYLWGVNLTSGEVGYIQVTNFSKIILSPLIPCPGGFVGESEIPLVGVFGDGDNSITFEILGWVEDEEITGPGVWVFYLAEPESFDDETCGFCGLVEKIKSNLPAIVVGFVILLLLILIVRR